MTSGMRMSFGLIRLGAITQIGAPVGSVQVVVVDAQSPFQVSPCTSGDWSATVKQIRPAAFSSTLFQRAATKSQAIVRDSSSANAHE
jgi:hypothetical protein